MHYNQPQLNQEVFSKLTGVDEFLKQIGAESSEPAAKLSLKKEDLTDEMKIVVMEISK
jgi:hypothetical protein